MRIRLDLVILRLAAWLVPAPRRSEWLAEWRSELWYVRRGDPHASPRTTEALWFCLGAFQDAVWVRRNRPSLNTCRIPRLQSPLPCILGLAVVAAVSVFFASRSLDVPAASVFFRNRVGHLLMVIIALGIVAATTPLSLGTAIRRWIFLTLEIALLVPIVLCGYWNLLTPISSGGIQPHGLLVGYVLAFRWAFLDQRKRCPVCLRLVACPARIGQPSRTFLDWWGSEFLCLRGHGMLYVPEFETSGYGPRWMPLDAWWSRRRQT